MTASTKQSQPAYSGERRTAAKKKTKHFAVFFYHDWCKACGICMAFCPQEIISADKNGKPIMENADRCIGCRFCELHCPDFAITVSARQPMRRRGDV